MKIVTPNDSWTDVYAAWTAGDPGSPVYTAAVAAAVVKIAKETSRAQQRLVWATWGLVVATWVLVIATFRG